MAIESPVVSAIASPLVLPVVTDNDAGGVPPIVPYLPDAVAYDGTNDYLKGTSVTGKKPNGKEVTASVWVWVNSLVSSNTICSTIIGDSVGYLEFNIGTQGWADFIFKGVGGSTDAIKARSAISSIATGRWNHIMVSGKADSASSSRMWVNDVEATYSAQTTTDLTLNWQEASWSVGARDTSLLFNGDMTQLWITNEYIDLSVEANRRLFITSAGGAVDLGATGTNPTGVQPFLFYEGDVAAWATNKGTCSNLTVTGALGESTHEPVELP
jgi:hypothetical protein